MRISFRHTIIICLMIFLSRSVVAQTDHTIAIFDFEDKSRASVDDEISWWFPTQIQSKILESTVLTVVERTKLAKILEEQKFQMTGAVSDETAVEIGRIAGARRVVLGEFQVNVQNRYSANVRLVDVETARVERQWIDEGMRRSHLSKMAEVIAAEIVVLTEFQAAVETIAYLENDTKPFVVDVKASKDTVKIGEMVFFHVKPEADCFLTIIDIGTSGEIHVLFPNRNQRDNFVKAGTVFQTPYLRAGGPAGLERVKVLATMENVSFVDLVQLEKAGGSFLSIPNDETSKFSKDLEMIVTPLDNQMWSEAILEIKIVE